MKPSALNQPYFQNEKYFENIPNISCHVLKKILGPEEKQLFLNFLLYFTETM